MAFLSVNWKNSDFKDVLIEQQEVLVPIDWMFISVNGFEPEKWRRKIGKKASKIVYAPVRKLKTAYNKPN